MCLLVGLFQAHRAFCQLEVVFSLVGISLLHVYAAAWRAIGEIGIRDIHIDADDMVVAEILVNICGGYLTGSNRPDNGSGTCHTVASCKDAGSVFHCAPVCRLDDTAADGDAGIFEMPCLNALSDGDNHNIAGNAQRRLTGRGRGRPTVFDKAYHLR